MKDALAHPPAAPPATGTAPVAGDALTPPCSGDDAATQLLQDFLAGRSPRTLRAYTGDLRYFARFCGSGTGTGTVGTETQAAVRHLLSLEPGPANALVLRYRNAQLDAGKAPATINRRLAALRSVVALARRLGLVVWTLDVDSVPREGVRDMAGPSIDAVRKLFRFAEARDGARGARDAAVLHLLFDLGLRELEVCSLDRAHLDLANGKLATLGKGRRGRQSLSLPEPTRAALGRWLAARGEGDGPLFPNAHPRASGRLTTKGVWHLVTALGRAAGVPVRPHGLRHAAITEGLEQTGGNVRAVVPFSRHASVETIQHYDDKRRDLQGDVAAKVAASAAEQSPPQIPDEIKRYIDERLGTAERKDDT